MTDQPLTRPERAAEVMLAKRVKKRMDVKRHKCGTCCLCMHREVTFTIYHCRNNVARQHPMCERDGRTPRFEFDDSTLGEFGEDAT